MGRSGDDDYRRPKVDERDLGVRPETADLFLTLADKIDAEKAAIAKDLEGEIRRATETARRGDYLKAAPLYEAIAVQWRAKHFTCEADSWARRAADCRSAHRLKQRNARKGKG
jgi:hypothetical protein